MLCRNIFKVSVIVQNKPFGFCLLLLLLLFRTGLDCEMDGTAPGTTSAIGQKRENEEVDAICWAGAPFAIGAKRENEAELPGLVE